MTAIAIPTSPMTVRPAHLAAAGLVLAVLFPPVSQLTPRGGFERVPMLLEVALLGCLLARWVLHRARPALNTPLLLMLVACMHATATGAWAIHEHTFLVYGARALHAAAWAYGVYTAIGDRRDLLSFLRTMHGVGCATAAVGIAQLLLPELQADFTRENTEGAIGAALRWDDELGAGSIVRVTGTLAHPLGLALVLGCILPWTPALWQAARTARGRTLVAASAGVQVIGLALTYSRMAALALALATVLWIVRNGVRNRGRALAALCCAGLAALPLLPATIVERLFDPTHFEQSDSLIARMEMQLYGSDLGMQYGWFGIGYGCYGVAYEATAKGRYVEQARWMLSQEDWSSYELGDVGGHNTWLEIWVEQGVIGLALVGAALVVLVVQLVRTNRRLPHGSLARQLGLCCEAGLLSLFASTLVIHMQEAIVPWAWLGAVCAWLRLHTGARVEP